MTAPRVVGLDIGGANLKAATNAGAAVTHAFELWRQPKELAGELALLAAGLPSADRWAVTMTGELADCFPTKSVGVRHIVDAVLQAAGAREVGFWSTRGHWLTAVAARSRPAEVAAANWHALATWVGQSLVPSEVGLLFDIGSTTADLIPLEAGRPEASGRTDIERLASGELVYTGVRRTPLCALATQVVFRNRWCGVAAEWFSTTHDVYLLLGRLLEEPDNRGTANGRPATRAAARDRLARMVCCDADECSESEAHALAAYFASRQRALLRAAIDRLYVAREWPRTVVFAGSGAFLAREVWCDHPRSEGRRVIDLAECWSPSLSEAACAHALARLAAESAIPFASDR